MRLSMIVLVISLSGAAALAQGPASSDAAAGNDLQKAYIAQLQNTTTTSGLPTNVVVLYVARQLGWFTAEQAFVAAVNDTRTDQQTTASSSAPASVSNLEKTGIADLLALAIERGKVSQTTNGDSATLSTTPYGVATFFGLPDTAPNWETYAWARRLSLSGTFAKDIATSADFSTFSTGEAKFVILGNRSPRDVVFMTNAAQKLDLPLLKAMQTQNASCQQFFQSRSGRELSMKAVNPLADTLDNKRKGGQALTAAVVEQTLSALLPSPPPLSAAEKDELRACVMATAGLNNAMVADAAELKKLIDAYVDQNNHRQLSIAYLYTRDATVSDYSTIKLLASNDSSKRLTFSFNGQVDFNHRDTAASPAAGTAIGPRPFADDTTEPQKLNHVRSYSIESGITFGRFSNGKGDSTVSAKWLKPHDGGKSTVTGQGQINVHLNSMITLPVALAYNSRATTTVKKGLQLNFGLSSLFDAFLSNTGR